MVQQFPESSSLPPRNQTEHICPHDNLYTDFYSSIFHNSQKVEIIQISANEYINKI